MKRSFCLLSIFILSFFGFSQDYNANRYKSQVFPDVLTFPDVKYGEAPQWIWPYWDVDLNLDVYVPNGDDNPKRPLIIFAHAGGFINGSKEVDNMVAICDSFAQKGYVTASIDYRKGFTPTDGESCERAVYRAVQDGKAAVRYFKENASLYDLDTNYFFFGGMSAGGFISLHVGYMDKESERPESTYGGGVVNDLECLDCAGNDFEHTSKVKAIIDFWGGVQDTTILEEGDVPMLVMHGESDPVVPYVYGHPFGLVTLPESYGALPLTERADNVGISYEVFTSEGDLHMLDGSDNGTFTEEPNSFWSDTLLPETTRFLYNLIKPNTLRISDDSVVVCRNTSVDFLVSEGGMSHFVWDYNDELVTVISEDNSNEASLLFENEGNYTIKVVEFNEILCAGDTVCFNVNVVDVYSDFEFDITAFNHVEFVNESIGAVSYEWDFGDGIVSDEMEPEHDYEENGVYEVRLIVESEFGCMDTILKIINIEGLNVRDSEEVFILVYPNPVSNYMKIDGTAIFNKVEISDAIGRTIAIYDNINDYQFEANLTEWNNGVYFVSVFGQDDGLLTRKIIKKQ